MQPYEREGLMNGMTDCQTTGSTGDQQHANVQRYNPVQYQSPFILPGEHGSVHQSEYASPHASKRARKDANNRTTRRSSHHQQAYNHGTLGSTTAGCKRQATMLCYPLTLSSLNRGLWLQTISLTEMHTGKAIPRSTVCPLTFLV